jgi:cyanophycinase-like exopeptidase
VTRLLALLGSGETAPTMVKPHRAIFGQVGPGPSVLLDTPYGFQENADDISDKAVGYFAESTGRAVEVASLRRADGDALEREAALAEIASAVWIFAGPGSPTYALRQWKGTELPGLLVDKLAHGGAVVFASAAALTVGRYTVPVYEIYKAGEPPAWAEGMDLFDQPVAVIPHYDNAEGGHHDTRYCYLGERRLRRLEEDMPADGWVLGIDEHTGLVVDLDADTATVVGNGTVTLRSHGRSTVLRSGEVVAWSAVPDTARGAASGEGKGIAAPTPVADDPALSGGGTMLSEGVRAAEAAFDRSLGERDAAGAVRAVLALDDLLHQWAGDTAQSDASVRGRAALRRMIVRLGTLAETGARDPAQVVGPYVEALLAQRREARTERRFAAADRIRDELTTAGVEVRDTPEGTEWSLGG